MKRTTFFLTAFFIITLSLQAQQLNSFSPLAQVYLKHLGLTDKNNNGVIDKDEGEGYEEFTAKYGNADIGFPANGVTYGTNNNRLEEPEIINHYYINIRFKPDFESETTAIENEVKAFVYANNLPLVWLDDEQGTVMNAVNKILGEGWQEKKVTEDEAEQLYRKAFGGLGLRGLITEDPFRTGYNQLPELLERKTTYCFEAAQFGFWFFSQLGINSIVAGTSLDPITFHDIIKLTGSNRIIDYFRTSSKYKVPKDKWDTLNPLQSICEYSIAQAKKEDNLSYYEQGAIYNKYELSHIGFLMAHYSNNVGEHNEAIALGEFVLQNIEIEKIMRTNKTEARTAKNNLKVIMLGLIKSYGHTKNKSKFDDIERLAKQNYGNDKQVKEFLDNYRSWL